MEELLVHMAMGGRMFLLHWWTEYDRCHVVLTRTERSLNTAAELVFDEHPDAKIKGAFEIEVVGPSKAMLNAHAAIARSESVGAFYQEMACRMRIAVQLGLILPAPFAICYAYEPDGEYYEVEGLALHYGCRNCVGGARLMGMTPEALFDKYHADWRAANPIVKSVYPQRRQRSSAAPAIDGEPLWYASDDMGHHSTGVNIAEVDWGMSEEYRPEYLSDRLMFLFRRLRELDTSAMQAFLDKCLAAAVAKREAREVAQAEAFKRREHDDAAAAISFFRNNLGGTDG